MRACSLGSRWHSHGQRRQRYSLLAQIDSVNVSTLQPVWTFRVGKPAVLGPVTFQTTPLTIDGRLCLGTGDKDDIALDGEAGRQI